MSIVTPGPTGGPTPASHPAPFFLPRCDHAVALIDQAVELWTDGYAIAAAMLARAALEAHLRHISRAKVETPLYLSVGQLLRFGQIDRLTFRHVNRLFTIGARVCHARPATFDAIGRLLYGSRGFIATVTRRTGR